MSRIKRVKSLCPHPSNSEIVVAAVCSTLSFLPPIRFNRSGLSKEAPIYLKSRYQIGDTESSTTTVLHTMMTWEHVYRARAGL